ncbi:MAG: DinB family protein [Anaerolineae bacterium]|nr:DinB family protein [Anaerolineae bacterium]
MIKAVLLDLDDTLLHTHTDHFVRRYLEQLAQTITEQYPRLANAETTPGQALRLAARATSTSTDPTRTNGETFLGTIADLLHIPMAELMALFEAFHRGFYQELGNDVEVIPAAAPLVDRLIDMGMAVVIATNPFFAPGAVMQRLAWGGLDRPRQPYALITHIENMHFVKPSPHYYEEILARVGAEADEAIMIGDSMDNDIIPAMQAGLHTYWIDQGVPPIETPDGSGTLEDFARLVADGWLTTLKPRPRTADQVVPRLLGDTAALFGLISEMNPVYWHKRPDPTEWSPLETVCHLRDSESSVQRPRLERIVRENNPFISETPAPPGPGAHDLAGEDGSAALRAFWQERCLTLDLIQGLSAEDWARPARHSIFGPTTLLEMAHFTTRHDHLHISQLCETIGRCRVS